MNRRSPRAAVRYLIAAGAFALAVLSAAPVLSRTIIEPIEIDSMTCFRIGDQVPLNIHLTDGPAEVLVYSDPPGAVSYYGTVSSSSEIVMADSDPNQAPGDVDVYVSTGGSAVASTTISAMSSLANDGPKTD